MLESCDTCRFVISPDGCACAYIEKLRPGNEHEQLRTVALAMFKTPLPHRSSCPCPHCFMDRRWSFFPGQRPTQLRRTQ